MLATTYFLGLLAVAAASIDKTFIIELSPSSSLSGRSVGPHQAFHKRAESLEYTVRHEFNSPDTYLGLSLEVRSSGTNEEIRAQLSAIPGVRSVSQVQRVTLPVTFNTSVNPLLSFAKPAPLKAVAGTGNLGSALQMGGVDKLHALGIKGKGVKIGIIDTGVDYRHPALGAGFGPGFKIAGGYAFVADNGTTISNPDPLTTCYGGGHGTHVAGLIGMNSVPGSFDITGVAPEATLYAYKALDCNGHGGSDNIVAAMLKAQEDGVNIVSMSLGVGAQSFNGEVDPLAAVTKKLTDAGIAVVVAMANNVQRGRGGGNLYLEQWPSTEPSAIGVGAIANKNFPLVYSAVDSKGSTIKYASVWPIDLPKDADVFMVEDGCSTDAWNTALAAVTNVNNTIFTVIVGDGFTEGQYCQLTSVSGWSSASQKPVYIMAYNAPNNEPFYKVYDTPSQGYFGTVQFTNVNADDGAVLAANYEAAGGYGKYKLTFPNKNYESPPQFTGGNMDYYSNYGPVWHTYDLKPQISAPGGHTLSTWPLGTLGGYVILSGTSMATPYVSASFALIKTQYPKATTQQILNLIQTNASPLPWIYDKSILAATAQQGAGQINVYNAIFSKTTISPGQLKISDVSRTEYGTANITISNPSTKSKTYTLSHQGAGYTDYRLQYREDTQVPIYGNATFKTPQVTIAAGKSATVSVKINPPSDVAPDRLPVFGGFVKVASTDGESFNIPYLGPPYSLYNTPYLFISTSGTILPQIYGHDPTTGDSTLDTSFLEIDPALSYGYSFPTNQWTTEMRIDLIPANTGLKARNYGFNTTATIPTYQASSVIPTSKIFGYPSYGTIVRQAANTWNWPAGYSNSKRDTLVTADDGSQVKIGNGDVRFFVSVLRAGGTSGVQADYDTYLGPVMRFINS